MVKQVAAAWQQSFPEVCEGSPKPWSKAHGYPAQRQAGAHEGNHMPLAGVLLLCKMFFFLAGLNQA